ncbi:hypothetical protein GS489_00775 [Rhodococcus hoagii]|nr:hypothetical protein [Prescottella equi]
MPRKRQRSERHADALTALAVASHRPTHVVSDGGVFAVRVDFAFGRYLLATNTVVGPSDDPDATEWWTVRFFQLPDTATPLYQVRAQWLVDAFDDAVNALRDAGNWTELDNTLA